MVAHINRISWQRGKKKCSYIIQTYIPYVHKHYQFATVVFDKYPERPTNKCCTSINADLEDYKMTVNCLNNVVF